jgi:hypothetical protein
MMARRARWFSFGAASAIATLIDIRAHGIDAGELVSIDTGSEDEDNLRFARDCARRFNAPITVLKSDEYTDTWDVWDRRNYISGIHGAPCTGELKIAVRLAWQRPDDVHVFGYTADRLDVERAARLRKTFPELTVSTPLIDRGLTKAACLAMVEDLGLTLPRTYAMGFPNANCLKSGCAKATDPSYWALHRKHFPEGNARTCEIARRVGARLVIIRREKDAAGKWQNVRCFPDEVPLDQPIRAPIVPACDFLCHIAEQDLD